MLSALSLNPENRQSTMRLAADAATCWTNQPFLSLRKMKQKAAGRKTATDGFLFEDVC
jgi:hypothetical protein